MARRQYSMLPSVSGAFARDGNHISVVEYCASHEFCTQLGRLSCFVVNWYQLCLPIFSGVTSPILGKSYPYPNAFELNKQIII